MTPAPTLIITLHKGGATTLFEVAGAAGLPDPLFVFRTDDGGFRTLGPVRGCPVRLPERPARRGEFPPLAAVLRAVLTMEGKDGRRV